jgi:hypothetical protein
MHIKHCVEADVERCSGCQTAARLSSIERKPCVRVLRSGRVPPSSRAFHSSPSPDYGTLIVQYRSRRWRSSASPAKVTTTPCCTANLLDHSPPCHLTCSTTKCLKNRSSGTSWGTVRRHRRCRCSPQPLSTMSTLHRASTRQASMRARMGQPRPDAVTGTRACARRSPYYSEHVVWRSLWDQRHLWRCSRAFSLRPLRVSVAPVVGRNCSFGLAPANSRSASQVDGACHILRKSLLAVLSEVLGRDASKAEFDTFFTCAPCSTVHNKMRMLLRLLARTKEFSGLSIQHRH